jgi:hypothetical protein
MHGHTMAVGDWFSNHLLFPFQQGKSDLPCGFSLTWQKHVYLTTSTTQLWRINKVLQIRRRKVSIRSVTAPSFVLFGVVVVLS